jgi:uncharacterized membrane protein
MKSNLKLNFNLKTRDITLTGLLIAITEILFLTPIGLIRLPMVSMTIAHVPILIASININLISGILVALAFGLTSLFLAATQPAGLLDPFFINPLISIVPRLFIPVMTYFIFNSLKKYFDSSNKKKLFLIALSTCVGHLTNTFGVYYMLYFIYGEKIIKLTHKSSHNLFFKILISLISSLALFKCLLIVLIATPIIFVLESLNKNNKSDLK